MNDDFYIGYLDESPPGLARHTRRWILALVALMAVTAAAIAALQSPAETGVFEFGHPQLFEGVLHELPLPLLHSVSEQGSVTNYLLVGSGKRGLPAFARGRDGERVRFNGTLIQKGAAVMVELTDEKSFQALGKPTSVEPQNPAEDLGNVALTGELVDTKCYFGVMRPATGKVHRACAVRCLSGGVPPGLLVRDEEGNGVVVMLVGPSGKALDFEVGWAARVVEAGGRLSRQGEILTLAVTRLRLAAPTR